VALKLFFVHGRLKIANSLQFIMKWH
jgi:hypothetical protein